MISHVEFDINIIQKKASIFVLSRINLKNDFMGFNNWKEAGDEFATCFVAVLSGHCWYTFLFHPSLSGSF